MSDSPADETPLSPATPAGSLPDPAPTTAPVPAPPPADAPGDSAVDLHVKLGPLQDRADLRPRAAQVWAWALAGGGLAGFGSWIAGETVLDWFVAEVKTAAEGGRMGGADSVTPATVAVAATRNAALAFGLLGWLMAFLLGLAGGLVRSSLRSGLRAALVGSGLGLAAGVASAMAVLPVYARILERPEAVNRELLIAIVALGAVWGAVGAAAGAAFGLGMGGMRRAGLGLVGGFLGGLLGATIFIMIGSIAFPLGGATLPISDSPESRLMARALAALCTSAGVAALVAPTRFEGDVVDEG